MPEDNLLENEIREIARNEATKSRNVTVDNLPEVQKVDVQNWPEQKTPEVNVTVPEIKVPEPKVTVNTPKQEPPVVNIETDLSELLTAIKENKTVVEATDFSELSDLIRELTKVVKEKPVAKGGGGAIGPSKYSILNTSGQAIDPATDTSILRGKKYDGENVKIRGTGKNSENLAVQEINSHKLEDVIKQLKIISLQLSFLTEAQIEESEIEN